jgi:predicted phage terminase large subunit-like protein
LDLAKLLEDESAIDAELGKRSLRDFIGLSWPQVEPAKFIPNWHIDAIAEHLQAVTAGQIKNLLINVPPGCSKSLVTCVFWPSWEWIQDQTLRSLFASYDQQLSTRDAVKTRLLIASSWFKARWPHVQIRAGQDEKTYYETTKGGFRLSTSIGGHGTGQHPHRVIADDPHKVREAESEVERLNAKTWWDLTIGLRGITVGVRRVVIMQRLNEDDLAGHILKTDPTFTHLILPMRYEPKRMVETPIGWNDPRKIPGELLAPNQFNEATVKDMERRLGAYGVAGQLQQRPAPLEGGIFKRAWFKFYKSIPRDDKGVPQFDRVVIFLDATFKETKSGSYVVGQVWGRRFADFWLLDQFRNRMDFTETCVALQALASKWPWATAKLIEGKANGPAIISAMRHKMSGLIEIPADASTGGKIARAQAVAPLAQAGNVWLPDPSECEWIGDWLGELCTFPNSAYNDQVDATSGALAYLEAGAYRYQLDEKERLKAGEPPKTLEEMRARQFAEKVRERANPTKNDGNVPERYKHL